MIFCLLNQSISETISYHKFWRYFHKINVISIETNKLSINLIHKSITSSVSSNHHTSGHQMSGQSLDGKTGDDQSVTKREDNEDKSQSIKSAKTDTNPYRYNTSHHRDYYQPNGSNGPIPRQTQSANSYNQYYGLSTSAANALYGSPTQSYYGCSSRRYYGYNSYRPNDSFSRDGPYRYTQSLSPNASTASQPTFKSDYNCSQTLSEDEVRQKVSQFRPFIKTKAYKTKSNGFDFSIMSYNILSQNLLSDHKSLYTHCDPKHLEWPERGHRIVRELLDSKVDIMCLQEVHSQHLKELIDPELSKSGYNVVYKQRTGDKMDGCVIAFKHKKFSLVKSTKLELMRRDMASILDRDNIGLVVELQPKSSKISAKLFVANTHLLYNPKRGDIKMAQMRLLLAELDKLARISTNSDAIEYNPIVLCGDFNSDANSLLCKFITTGALNLRGSKMGDISGQSNGYGRGKDVERYHLDLSGVTSDSQYSSCSADKSDKDRETANTDRMSLKHNFNFKSIFNDYQSPHESSPSKKWISTSNCHDSALVDYIFYDYKKLTLLGLQRLLNGQQMNEIENIPNAYLGSDHLSLKAKFLMH